MGPAGLAGASFVLSAYELGWIASGEERRVGLLIAVFAVGLQAAGAAVAFLSGNGAAGRITAVLAAAWLAIGVSLATDTPNTTSSSLGFLLIAAAAVVVACLLTAPPSARVIPVFALTALRYAVGAGYELSRVETWQNVSGVIGLAVAAVAVVAAAHTEPSTET